jgi:hypothetical protein
MNASTAIFLDLLVNDELHGDLLRLSGLVLDGDVLLHGGLLLVHLHLDLLRLGVRVLGGGGEGGGFQRSAFYGGLLVNFIFDASFTLLHFRVHN